MQPDATLTTKQTRAATLEAGGTGTAEIAAAVGVHRATVFRWRKDAAYRGLVASIASDAQRVARRALEAEAHTAAERLVGLLGSDDDRVRLRTALAILDRTGHGPGRRVELQAVAVATVATVELARPIDELDRLLTETCGSWGCESVSKGRHVDNRAR